MTTSVIALGENRVKDYEITRPEWLHYPQKYSKCILVISHVAI